MNSSQGEGKATATKQQPRLTRDKKETFFIKIETQIKPLNAATTWAID
jgi:hypothetical protein